MSATDDVRWLAAEIANLMADLQADEYGRFEDLPYGLIRRLGRLSRIANDMTTMRPVEAAS